MNIPFSSLCAFSIGLAVIISAIRFKKISRVYYPFLLCVSLALVNEFLSFFVTSKTYTSGINNNIYVLIESLLILWQFRNWDSFKKRQYLFWVIAGLFLVTWVVEIFFIRPIYPGVKIGILEIASYFRILYSFILVLLAINQLNELIVRDRRNILLNPVFLICVGIVLYFTYKVLVETFWSYGIMQASLITNVYKIHDWINLFSNLIYAFAILWMQKRQRFLLPS